MHQIRTRAKAAKSSADKGAYDDHEEEEPEEPTVPHYAESSMAAGDEDCPLV